MGINVLEVLDACDSSLDSANIGVPGWAEISEARRSLVSLIEAGNRFVASLDACETIHSDDGDDVSRMVEYAHAEAGFRRALAAAQGGKSDG